MRDLLLDLLLVLDKSAITCGILEFGLDFKQIMHWLYFDLIFSAHFLGEAVCVECQLQCVVGAGSRTTAQGVSVVVL